MYLFEGVLLTAVLEFSNLFQHRLETDAKELGVLAWNIYIFKYF